MVDELAHALLPQGSFLTPFLNATGIYGIRYVLLAGTAFLVWYARRPEGKLQRAMPQRSQIRREIAYSAIAVLVFGLVIGAISGYGIAPHTLVYLDVARYGWAYFWLSIPLVVLAHDAYFYWTHRLMHTPALFRAFHGVHHLSRNPTPWTAYAFHPLESVVQALGLVLIIFTIPLHPTALLIFHTISTATNVYGHLGYELYPGGWAQHPLGRWINTSVAHNAHHDQARCNFGFYFLFWDRLMGTLDPAYEAKYRKAFAAGLRS
ncbi:MAG TPA: sterol desaturase family protein [Burkholderiales bacterium]|jgi:lathosterol oxidase|nr:sterol desaturase family protein [Burkholderiales bacterium]